MSALRVVNYSNVWYIFAHSKIARDKFRVTSKPTFSICNNVKYFSHSEKSTEDKGKTAVKKIFSFESMINERRKQAERSILVQVQSDHSYPELHSYCSQHGTVKEMHHYSLSNDLHFILVEFSNVEDVAQVMDVCGHINQSDVVPVKSPLLWFRVREVGSNINSKLKKSKSIPVVDHLPPIKRGNVVLPSSEITERLIQATTHSQQIEYMYTLSQLDEVGTRLRFFTAHQVECALRGLFPNMRALPFGSSVNGFGRKGSDLDLCLQFDEDFVKRKHREEGDDSKAAVRLVFQAKTTVASGRAQIQRQMETVGDILQLFLPGCTHVRRILQARVPIVKYHQDLTGLECDLSMTNLTAVYMSELLWIMGTLDSRVRPLVFFVRHWAKAAGLTYESPGPFITNFTLTLLVIHYLQCCKPNPVLPSLSTLISMASPADRRISDDGVNCTFLRDVSNFAPSKNKESLQSLLFGFYEFYSTFDFHGKGLSLAKGHGGKSGIGITKPDASPLYVENPLERMLNVSKNVNGEELERFKIQLRNAAWIMEELVEHSKEAVLQEGSIKHGVREKRKNSSPWGLMELLNPASKNHRDNTFSVGTMMRINARGRLVKVTDLFDDSDSLKTPVKDSQELLTEPISETKR
ncbi:hypothetical protein J437_LFUL009109 [Ladona fulva]|uniref:Poly(A) RNA polymerase, mitochondrial n=1 Tax=Ladona fulva TaxID=123851 RepID=A0A8K0K5U3_LADFU|nr:hypothetical protein J437_LFUL009109 [Ladona fulva]